MANSGDTTLRLVVDDLVRQVRELSGVRGEVQGLAAVIEGLAAQQKVAKPAPAWWPGMDDQEHGKRWGEFLTWLRDVLAQRYPADAASLSGCWRKHPAAVDALTAAWLTWQAAYLNRAAEPRDAATWQVQWRPQLVALAAADLSRCRNAGEHKALPTVAPAVLASFEPLVPAGT